MYLIINNPPIEKIKKENFFNIEYYPESYEWLTKSKNDSFQWLSKKLPLHKLQIEENGFILLPPIAVENNINYELVIGKRTIEYIYRKYKSIPQLLLITGIDDRKKLFRIVLKLKRFLFGINPVEKAIALKRAAELYGDLPAEVLNILEIPAKRSIIEKYLKINETSDKIKSLVASGEIDPQTVFRIFIFPYHIWDDISEFIFSLKIGTKHRNRLLEMIHEISIRDGLDPVSLIGSKDVKSILSSKIDPPQKAKRVFGYFEALRYPTIKRYRESFDKKLKKIGFKNGLSLGYDPTFEKRDFKISFSFSSIEDFRRKVNKLSKISVDDQFLRFLEGYIEEGSFNNSDEK